MYTRCPEPPWKPKGTSCSTGFRVEWKVEGSECVDEASVRDAGRAKAGKVGIQSTEGTHLRKER